MVDFVQMHRRSGSLVKALEDLQIGEGILQSARELETEMAELAAAERGEEGKPRLPDYLSELLQRSLTENGIRSGVIAEIGGAQNSLVAKMKGYKVRFLSLFPLNDPRFLVADICNCPHVPANSFDAVFSVSVLEHVNHIHDAGREITRILKPGGITMHAVPFSYFFHGAPADYWRVSTTALETIFAELETIDCFFYAGNRRRNNLGSPSNPVDQDGGKAFAPDAFGGWRENWYTIYIGRKVANGAERLLEKRVKQALIDIVKGLTERGVSDDRAVEKALSIIPHVCFDAHGRVMIARHPTQLQLFGIDAATLKYMWLHRSKKTIRPSIGRPNLMALLDHAGLLSGASPSRGGPPRRFWSAVRERLIGGGQVARAERSSMEARE